jgi:hypothetical protein
MPDKQGSWDNRYYQAHMRTSGFALVTFDQQSRDIHIDCYTFLADVSHDKPINQFPGWPVTINQLENGGKMNYSLPTVEVSEPGQVIAVHDSRGELIYNLRMPGKSIEPGVFEEGSYTIRIGEGENVKEISNISTGSKEKIHVNLLQETK